MRQAVSIRVARRRIIGRLATLLAATLFSITTVAPTIAATEVSGSGLELLAELTTAPEHPSGYVRTLFVHWIDADKDGCSTRSEVLIAESQTTAQVTGDCSVAGSWRSAYDGIVGTIPSKLDIDHMIPLKEAWDSGAWAWTPARRKSFANDLGDWRSLRAVTAASNRSKGDRDPAQWLPPLPSFRCTYASEWVAVKVRWSLYVDTAERSALKQVLAGCPVHVLTVAILPASSPPSTAPAIPATPGPAATPTQAPSPVAAGPCDPNYSGYCVPIVPYDLDCGDIGHRVTVVGVDIHGFDGDGDGIGCESYA